MEEDLLYQEESWCDEPLELCPYCQVLINDLDFCENCYSEF